MCLDTVHVTSGLSKPSSPSRHAIPMGSRCGWRMAGSGGCRRSSKGNRAPGCGPGSGGLHRFPPSSMLVLDPSAFCVCTTKAPRDGQAVQLSQLPGTVRLRRVRPHALWRDLSALRVWWGRDCYLRSLATVDGRTPDRRVAGRVSSRDPPSYLAAIS